MSEACTTASGISEGTDCVGTLTSMLSTVNRCVVLCDNMPEECSESAICAAAVSVGPAGIDVDYTDGHCAALSYFEK